MIRFPIATWAGIIQASTTRRVARQNCENSSKSRRRASEPEGNPAAAEWTSAGVARQPDLSRGGVTRQIFMLVPGGFLGFSEGSYKYGGIGQ
jgi:hypothetical protein